MPRNAYFQGVRRMTLALLLIGVGSLIALPWVWKSNWDYAAADPPARWRAAWRLRWPIGLVLGAASLFMFYPVYGTEDQMWYRVFGVPFPAFAFDERGHDYVGGLSLPMMALNCVVWLFFPHFVFLGARIVGHKTTGKLGTGPNDDGR